MTVPTELPSPSPSESDDDVSLRAVANDLQVMPTGALLWACNVCGLAVTDRDRHIQWHGLLVAHIDGHRIQEPPVYGDDEL